MPTITFWFWLLFATTLVLLGATLASGFRGRRRMHLRLAPVLLAALGITIVLAERMGEARRFPAAEMRIHLWFAKSATLLVLPVVVSGLLLLRRPGARIWHRVAVLVFLAAALTATGTGIWAYSLSVPR